MELTEKAFVFSTYALIALQNGDKRTKKEIVSSLDMNRTIKDKILNIEAHEWYSEIKKGYFSIKEILAEYEPDISLKQKTLNDFPRLRSLLRGLVDEVETAIRDYNGYIYIPEWSKKLEKVCNQLALS